MIYFYCFMGVLIIFLLGQLVCLLSIKRSFNKLFDREYYKWFKKLCDKSPEEFKVYISELEKKYKK